MFRKMRRFAQELTAEENAAVLQRGTHGVLAVSGDDGYPYAVPVNYYYEDGMIFIHCAVSGHKLDAVRNSEKVSFCVVDQDQVVPEKRTDYFRSVIAFGRARVVDEPERKRQYLLKLGVKYSPEDEQGCREEIEEAFGRVCLLEIDIEHLTGKQAKELGLRKN